MNLDARAVANCVIELSLDYDLKLTHLNLQKILYFLHGRHLVEHDEPLVAGHFEAWKFGPVHPLIFSNFKHTRGAQIVEKAERLNPLTGARSAVGDVADKKTKLFIRSHAVHYLKVPAGRLVDLSHASGSSWDLLTRRDGGARVFGDRISNDLIKRTFHRHIIPIRDEPLCGEPDDEQPPS